LDKTQNFYKFRSFWPDLTRGIGFKVKNYGIPFDDSSSSSNKPPNLYLQFYMIVFWNLRPHVFLNHFLNWLQAQKENVKKNLTELFTKSISNKRFFNRNCENANFVIFTTQNRETKKACLYLRNNFDWEIQSWPWIGLDVTENRFSSENLSIFNRDTHSWFQSFASVCVNA